MSAAGWMAAGQIIGELGGLWMQSDAQHRANRTNIRLARENRDWMERMSNTEMQRHVDDLRKAGLNPMLGYSGQASTPNVSPARVEPTYSGGGIDTAAKVMQMQQLSALTKQAEASARLTNADAAIKEHAIPHAARSAQAAADKLQEEVVRLGQDVEKADVDIGTSRLSQDQLRKMQPLMEEYQRLVNEAERLGLSEKRAFASFYDSVGGMSKWMDMVSKYLPFLKDLKPLPGKRVGPRP